MAGKLTDPYDIPKEIADKYSKSSINPKYYGKLVFDDEGNLVDEREYNKTITREEKRKA